MKDVHTQKTINRLRRNEWKAGPGVAAYLKHLFLVRARVRVRIRVRVLVRVTVRVRVRVSTSTALLKSESAARVDLKDSETSMAYTWAGSLRRISRSEKPCPGPNSTTV